MSAGHDSSAGQSETTFNEDIDIMYFRLFPEVKSTPAAVKAQTIDPLAQLSTMAAVCERFTKLESRAAELQMTVDRLMADDRRWTAHGYGQPQTRAVYRNTCNDDEYKAARRKNWIKWMAAFRKSKSNAVA